MAEKRKVHPLSIRILCEMVLLIAVLAVILIMIGNLWADMGTNDRDDDEGETTETTTEGTTTSPVPADTSPEGILQSFMQANNLTEADYPAWWAESYAIAGENRDFLLNYPLKKDNTYTVDISDVPRDTVPLFLQWDERWGYQPYGVNVCGVGGCGPTCLSMVAYYLTGDPKYTPPYMLQFATEGGHVIRTGGTDWSLFNRGAVALGFTVKELPNVKGTVAKYLKEGIPVVINVKPGTFTTTGHYMVLVGYEDGKFRINDPNSPDKSARLWDWEEFDSQVRNFWAISLPTQN